MEDELRLPRCPCGLECKKRSVGCHINCKEYIEWKEIRNKVNHKNWLQAEGRRISDTKRNWLAQKAREKNRH